MRQVEVVVSGVVSCVVLSLALAGCGEHPRPSGDGIAVARAALFTNGDFEADAIGAVPTGWTVQHYLNAGINDTVSVPPNATSVPQTLASLNLIGTGSEANGTNGILATLIVGGPTEQVADPDPLMANVSLKYPKYGTRAVLVNLKSTGAPTTTGASNNVNALRQTMTVTNADVDAADNKVHIRFTVAPVLQNPNHAYSAQPYYFVRLQNITKGTTLYSDFNTSAQPGVPWKIVGSVAGGNAIYYTDWQLVDIGPGNAGLAVGDQVELLVIASGCGAGGHWGRVYVDGIGSTIPGIYTAATGPASANAGANITYVVSYKNGGTATAAATQLNIVIPTNTTYQSNSLPSACSGLSAGATGTLVCSLGALAAGASGSFTVTLNINSGVAAGSIITNGNYSIQATGVTALLGPKVLTTVTSGVTYADVSVTKTDGVAAVGWGQAVTYTVQASNAGPGAASTVTIADTMPAQFSGATWTCAGTSGGTCSTASGTGNLSGTIALPVGATATYTIQGSIIAGTGTGTVTNTATATLGGGALDPDTTNNSAVDTDSIGVLRTLSITKTNPNGGSVITVPASINCGTSCSAATGSFVDGTSVVITASPVSGASFTAWGGACAGGASTCTLTMTGNQTVTAAFTPPPTVTVTTGNNQGAAVGTAFATQLKVRVLDSASNPLVGQTVLFTLTVPPSGASASLSSASVTTDASGFASTTATANGTAGAYSVVAALSGTPTTGTFSLWNYGVATAVSLVAGGSPQSATVTTAFANPLAVIVRDAAGQPVPNVVVTFTGPASGALATLNATTATTTTVTTPSSGLASVTATAGQTSGSFSVTASATGIAPPATFALTSTAGAAASITATSGGGQTALLGSMFTLPLTVTVRDAFSNPVTGAAVTFTAPGSSASVSLGTASGTTSSSGQFSTTAIATGTVGLYAVGAAVAGVVPQVSFSLANSGTLALAPTTVTVAPRASVTFSATGDPAASYLYALFTNNSVGSINGATGVYTAGATGGVADVVRVTDSLGRTATATVTVGSGVSISPSPTSVSPRGSRTFSAAGGSGTGFAYVLSTNASAGSINSTSGVYVAGAAGGVTDVVRVTDSLGNTATATVSVGSGVSISPSATSTSPLGARTFSAVGGSGTGFVYALSTNASGGSINGASGIYVAGVSGGVTDVVSVTDSLGNTASAMVTVGSGVTISPSTVSVSPRGTRTFSASGGSGTGFTYALSTNPSAGSINGASGVYVAGATGGVTDVVRVTDSLGNTASATVTVGSGVSISPSTVSVAPRGTRTFSASGGSGTGFVYALSPNASGGTIDTSTGVYVAGATGGVTDMITATDSLGSSVIATVTVGSGVSISPALSSVSPRGSRTFTASGGSGTGFTYALSTNASTGSINGTSGVYVAGATGGVTDVVRVTDSLGNTASATVTVGSAVSISPTTTSTSPRGTKTFSASGGSGTGFTYALPTNASAGSINGTSGVYVAGATGGVTDVVRVTDSLGNTASATVTVGAGVSISPSTTSTSPRGTRTFAAAGGSGTGFTYALSTNASGGTIDSSTGVYVAGATGGVTDIVTATDSFGSNVTASISVGSGINLSPAASSTTPRGTILFTATGGSATAYVYAVTTNNSGATIDATGKYVAGDTGSVGDVVGITDSLGNTASSAITVGPGVTVTPSLTSTAPRGARTFTAAGGSGTGYTYTLSTNASGGSINSTTGAYTAGATGSVNDGITVTDSLGNSGTASVSVNSGIILSPRAPSTTPQGTVFFAATAGSGAGYSYSVTTNRSGATIDASGHFIAGTTGSVTDVVTVTDSLGNTATSSVAVGPSVGLIASGTTSPPRGSLSFSATGGSGAGFIFNLGTNASGGTINAATGAYTAGNADSVTDTVVVTDALGNVATANIAVGVGVTITPASPATPPLGRVSLVASGGSGTGFAYTVVTNPSGGSIDGTTGLYTGGATGSSVDVVRVTDSLGNVATVAISVGNGLSINPSTPSLAPRQSQLFSAIGGSATGFTFTLSTNASGGRIDPTTGAYVAGSTGNTSDVVTVTDSIGNTARTTVQVGPGLVGTPTVLSLAPLGMRTFSVSGGSGSGYRFSLSTNSSGGTIDPTTGAYTAGATGGVIDVVLIGDSLGNTSSVPVTVTSALQAVSSLTLPPRGSATLAVTGGAGGNTFALTTNGSGATLNPLTGAYVAGETGGTSDLITVTDANGATATIRVNIGGGIALVPASASTSPRGQIRFTASGGSGSGYAYTIASNLSGGSIDASTGAYEAGATSNVVDLVEAVDSLGNTRSVSISIGGSLAINPATPAVAPRATVTFAVTGGSGSGVVFTLTDNMSGGSVDPATGVYHAGTAPNVSDQVTATDSRGNAVTATILVGAGVHIAPVSSRVAPGGAVVLSASGGSGIGYVFALTVNNSGGVVDIGTGMYTAGTVPSVVDTVTVSDSLGNSGAATVEVGAGVSLTASAMGAPPRGSVTLTASGGSGMYTFALRTNGSGASIVSTTGLYTAGQTPRTTDSIEATDMFGNSATIQISVGEGVSITPASPVVVPGGSLTFAALGGSGTGYVFALTTNGSGATIDPQSGAYVAGDSNDLNDVVAVTDSLGNTSSASIAIGDHIALNPPTSAAAPHATVQFTASGGSATGYVFAMVTNSSGATIDADTGAYQAGSLSNVTDVVQVVDSLGRSATAEVMVGSGLGITPMTVMIAPKDTIEFRVSGGSGAGHRFALTTNGSGGAVDATSGDYQAGGTGSTTDIVTVTDSLGNSAVATITIGKSLSLAPADTTLPPRGSARPAATGGAVPYAFSVSTNHSGASVNAATGEYVAGPTPDVEDTVTVTDANGVSTSVTISVGAGVSITPSSPKVALGGTLQLAASGGGGTGYTWSIVDNGAGGVVDATSGRYTASRTPAPETPDVVEARDTLGNTAQVTILQTVTTVKTVSASGGSGGCNVGATRPQHGLAILLAALFALAVRRKKARRSPLR